MDINLTAPILPLYSVADSVYIALTSSASLPSHLFPCQQIAANAYTRNIMPAMRSTVVALFALTLASAAHTALIPARQLRKLVFRTQQQHCIGGNAHDRHMMYPSTLVTCVKKNEASSVKSARWDCYTSSVLYRAFLRIHHARVHCEANESGVVDSALCKLDYYLDFTMFTVFMLGFVATALCGGLVAMAMYVALGRVMKEYYAYNGVGRSFMKRGGRGVRKDVGMGKERGREDGLMFCSVPMSSPMDVPMERDTRAEELRALYATPPGYGSFGRKLEIVGDFCGSFTSLADLEQPTSPRTELGDADEEGDERGQNEGNAARLRREHQQRVGVLQTELFLG